MGYNLFLMPLAVLEPGERAMRVRAESGRAKSEEGRAKGEERRAKGERTSVEVTTHREEPAETVLFQRVPENRLALWRTERHARRREHALVEGPRRRGHVYRLCERAERTTPERQQAHFESF